MQSIFDEYSMIGCRLMDKIHQRCCEGKANNSEPFGGLFIYFFGDLRQLPPVKDTPLFAESSVPTAHQGKLVFTSIQRSFVLRIS